MRKVSARWVLRMLTEEQKKVCIDVCTDLLSRLQAEPQTVLDRIVTQDETWVHHFETRDKTAKYDMEACHFSHPKEIQDNPTTGKVTVTVFWDSQGVIMTNYLSKGSTVTGVYYASELRELREALTSKRRRKLRRRVLLLHDNALQLTPPALRRLLQLNVATNCCLIHHIRKI